ncbi:MULTISPECIES: acyl carrier protein [Colwellia]|uniref:Acyl carrier protein n=1 Tax=Colwellia maritima TaxID=2912588 RepID=A0ABS9WYI5_9GAMM|nr:acyl carrier protein [Colwellia maritima]MCI2282597.1 acyl carrier protein [Colwellia maritima]
MELTQPIQSKLAQLKDDLKKLIVEECEKEDDFAWQEILDDEQLFGSDSRINLDSLDGLQLSLVLKRTFGVKIEGSKESRKHLTTINSIAALIVEQSTFEQNK